MRHLGLGFALVLVGCAHNVPQDKATGPDGRQKGAVPIALENDQGKAHGIVTYPGGDRVDWKSIQIPDGKQGTLELTLSWKTPRPGLRVAFDVFDQWNTPLVQRAAQRRSKGHTQLQSLFVKSGTYYVRVFAPNRTDAGEYKLVANFTEYPQIVEHGFNEIEIPEPPKLPAVPAPEETCDKFDPANQACISVCPEVRELAPQEWKACADRDKKTTDAAAREQAYKDCLERKKTAPKPFDKRILNVSLQGDEAQVTLGIGTNSEATLDTSWTAQVLTGDTGKPLAGGTVRITRVEKTKTIANVKLTTDALNRNPMIRFTPPAQETCTR